MAKTEEHPAFYSSTSQNIMSPIAIFPLTNLRTRILVLSLVMVMAPRCLSAPNFVETVHRGDEKQIRSALAQFPDLEARDAEGNTALHWAALNGDARLVKELLDRGASVAATNNVGASPLLYAVANIDSVRALLDKGASINVASKFGTTPLMAAARYPESSAVVRLLLDQLIERGAVDFLVRVDRAIDLVEERTAAGATQEVIGRIHRDHADPRTQLRAARRVVDAELVHVIADELHHHVRVDLVEEIGRAHV